MKVITYNIHKCIGMDNKPSLKEIIKYLKKVDADIICLQEVLYPQFLKIKSKLKINGMFACNTKTRGISYGVCTFSKFNIEDSSHMLLTSKKEQRGMLATGYEIQGNTVNIINVHLGLDKYERYNQIDEIISYSNRLSGGIVICGDFNEKNITINKFSDIAVLLGKYKENTFIPSDARIDYIFISKDLNPVKYNVDRVMFSDHYPVVGCIRQM